MHHGEKSDGLFTEETRRTIPANQNVGRSHVREFAKRRDFRPRTFGMSRFNRHGPHGRPVKSYDFYDNKDSEFGWFKEQGHNKYPYHDHLPSYSNEGYEEYQKPPDASSVAHAIDTLEKHMTSSEALNSDNMFRNKGRNGGGFQGDGENEENRDGRGEHMNGNEGEGFHGEGNQNGGDHEDGHGGHMNNNGGGEFFGGDRGGGHHEGNQESHGSNNEFHEDSGNKGHGNSENHHSEHNEQDHGNHGHENNEHGNNNDNHMTGHFGWPKIEGPALLNEDHKEHGESHGNEGGSHGGEGQSHGGEGFWSNGDEGHGQHDKPREGWLPLKPNEHEEHSQHEGQGQHEEHGVEGSQFHEGGHKMLDDHSPPVAQPELNHHSEDRDVFGGTGAKNEDPHANEVGNYGRKIITGQVPEADQIELHKEQPANGHQEDYVDFPKANNEQNSGHNRDNMLREPPSFVARQQQQWQQQQVAQQQLQQMQQQQQQQQQQLQQQPHFSNEPQHDGIKPKNVEGQQTIVIKQDYPHSQEKHFDSLPKGPHEGPERGGGLWGNHPGQGEQYYIDPEPLGKSRNMEQKSTERTPQKEVSNFKSDKIDVEVGIPTGGPTDNKNITFAIKEVPLKPNSDGLRQGYNDSDIKETARTANISAGTQQMMQQTAGKETEANSKPTKRVLKVPVKITTGSFDSRDILSFETDKKFIGGEKSRKGFRENLREKGESDRPVDRWEGTGLKRKLRKYNFGRIDKEHRLKTGGNSVKGKLSGSLQTQSKERKILQDKAEESRNMNRNLKSRISGGKIDYFKKANHKYDEKIKNLDSDTPRIEIKGNTKNPKESFDGEPQKKYVLTKNKGKGNGKQLVARHGTENDLGAVHGHPAISDEQAMHSSPEELLEMANGYRHRAEEYESKAKELENHAEVQDHQFGGHGAISQHQSHHEGPERGGGLEGHEEGQGEQYHHGEGFGHWSGPTWHGPGPFGSSHFGHGEGGHEGGGHEGGGHEGGDHDEVIHFNTGYPFYHVPRPHNLPNIEYHKPHPPVHGLNPYEVLTSEQFHHPELPAGHGNLPYGANQRTLAPKADIERAKKVIKNIHLDGKEKENRYDTIMRDFLTDENMETFLLK